MTDSRAELPELPWRQRPGAFDIDGAPPLGPARMRQAPEDFEVEEIPVVEPDGAGEHLWLWLEKRGQNSDWVARQLAAASGLRPRDVGYAGLKDRHAVTRQYFSLAVPPARESALLEQMPEGVRLLRAARHSRKLQKGALRGNCFHLRLYGVQAEWEDIAARLLEVDQLGVPNYFGLQRFGMEGGNLQRARGLLEGREREPRRHQRGLYLSAARSALFNQVLATRVMDGSWNRVLPGDIVQLAGSRSRFVADDADELADRCMAHDLSPTGPMAPLEEAQDQPGSSAWQREREWLAPLMGWSRALAGQGLSPDRRPLRMSVRNLSWQLENDLLELAFELDAGSYATTLLEALFDIQDMASLPNQEST